MSGRTVMEKADDIMASMGLADTVPLAESTTESINSVGKNYGEELPELSDDQRNALLEHSLGEGKMKDLSIKAEEGDEEAKKTIQSLEGKPPAKKKSGSSKVQRKARGRHRRGLPLKKGHAKHVANDPKADLDAQINAANRLAKKKANESKEAIARKISKLNEMTTIGMLGSSSVGGTSGSNWSPAKKKKKKGKKSSSKFISFQLGKV